MRQTVLALTVVGLTIGGTTACATKKYVQQQVGEVNDKVATLSQSVEETQEQTRQNGQQIGQAQARIGEVDGKTQRAQQAADAAQSSAEAVDGKVGDLDRASRRLVYEVVLNEEQGNFKFGDTALPDAAKAEIDRVIEMLKNDPKNVYIEIEGHTDSVGSKQVNQGIGLKRAEAVKRYLYEQYQVPLHKISVISYGEDKPVAPNNTRDGRAKNRRVVIRVLA